MTDIIGRRIVHGQGDYWKNEFGNWCVWIPDAPHFVQITGNPKSMANWEVEEHANGTISVTPSINMQGTWHGYLVQGVWRSC